MTEQTKKVLRILGWELLVLAFKLMLLFFLLIPTVLFSFTAIWNDDYIVNFCIWACYWSLAFVLVVLLPFRKHVYLRCSKMARRRIWLAVAVAFAVAFLILFESHPMRHIRRFFAIMY